MTVVKQQLQVMYQPRRVVYSTMQVLEELEEPWCTHFLQVIRGYEPKEIELSQCASAKNTPADISKAPKVVMLTFWRMTSSRTTTATTLNPSGKRCNREAIVAQHKRTRKGPQSIEKSLSHTDQSRICSNLLLLTVELCPVSAVSRPSWTRPTLACPAPQ